MEEKIWTSNSVEETKAIGEALGQWLHKQKLGHAIALCGDLGAGKTHLAQGIGKGFGVTESLSSPTFAIMNTYDVGADRLYHFDLYRLENARELEAIGFTEFSARGKSIIEWPNLYVDHLPMDCLWIDIEKGADGEAEGQGQRRFIARRKGFADCDLSASAWAEVCNLDIKD